MKKLIAIVVLLAFAFVATPVLAAGKEGAGVSGVMTEESFVMWDSDKDEFVVFDEFEAKYTGDDAQEKFKMMDKNNDGKLSKEEFTHGTHKKGY
jgi:hypothetical protein